MEKPARKILQGATVGLCCTAVIGAMYLLGALETLEFWTYDLRIQCLPAVPAGQAPRDVALIAIDQNSLENISARMGYSWPWPRGLYGKMVDYLADCGARAIVFDVFFSEPDYSRDELSGEQSDSELAAASRRSGRTFHSYVLKKEGMAPAADKAAAFATAVRDVRVETNWPGFSPERFDSATLPVPAFSTSSRAVGFASIYAERDNIFRRVPMLAVLGGRPVPSLSLATAWDLAGRPPLSVQPGRLQVGGVAVPVDRAARPFLWWYKGTNMGGTAFEPLSAAAVLTAGAQRAAGRDQVLSPGLFSNKVVVIGSTAPGLLDIRATPVADVTPGVAIQATAIANLLRGEFVTRSRPAPVLALLAAGCVLLGLVSSRGFQHAAFGVGTTVTALLAITLGGYWLLAARHFFLDIVPLLVGVASTFLVTAFVNYLSERQHSRLVRNIFEHYLDRSVVKSLIADPERVKLGGERRECTVMFTDVANFTSLSEKMQPDTVVRFMNVYLNAMTDIIISEGGFVDKFIGDEIVAIYGAPNDLPDHALRACRSVLRMAERTREMQGQLREIGCSAEVFARAGLSTGEVVVGNMGSDERMNYTAMGDVMNMGARLQGTAKPYVVRCIVSEATVKAAGDGFVCRELDSVRVKGKDQPVGVFELIGETASVTGAQKAMLADFARGLSLYRAGIWAEAADYFGRAARAGDPPAAVFLDRCRQFEAAPPAHWDGVYVMQTK